MLTETMSDPRRANWLTISSASEDLCWTEEFSNSRPVWELEAEVLRLTTRLMLRERELRQVKSQLKSQASQLQQQANNWRIKMEEKDEQMKQLLMQKDAEMQNIVSQLLLFEAELRKEQLRIEDLLSQKESQIHAQQKEIEHLQHKVCFSDSKHETITVGEISAQTTETSNLMEKTGLNSFSSFIKSDNVKQKIIVYQSNEPDESGYTVQKLKDGLTKIRAIQDVTNVQSLDFSHDVVFSEKKRNQHRTPQKMKDLKAKRLNTHKMQKPPMSETSSQVIL